MTAARRCGLTLAAGALAGLLTLGLGGRLAMAALVAARGARPEVTLGGSLEVIALGGGYGLVGGLLALAADRVLHLESTHVRDTLLALGLLGAAWATSRAGRSAASGLDTQVWLALGLAIGCFLAYGVLLHELLHRWLGTPAPAPPPARQT